MNFVVVILSGPREHLTRATVEFGRWGTKTNQPIMICDTWQQGFEQAKKEFSHALFVRAGTVFTDWEQWKQLLSIYPHKGLIAHIIWHPDQPPDINDQCWFADLSKFTLVDLDSPVTYRLPNRSSKNLHDDYTPLWITPNNQTEEITATGLGACLISQSVNRGDAVVNWNNPARDIKKFIYQDPWQSLFDEYFKLSEHQLWVLNNEPISVPRAQSILTPGSGLYWIMAAMQGASRIQVVDISETQIAFCKHIWTNWTGQDYGTFAWNFIQNNKIKHFELDSANLNQIDRAGYYIQHNFISHVNQAFETIQNNHNINDPGEQWKRAKTHCDVQFVQDNIIEYAITNDVYEHIWHTNVTDYKWSRLKTSPAHIEQFKKICDEKRNN